MTKNNDLLPHEESIVKLTKALDVLKKSTKNSKTDAEIDRLQAELSDEETKVYSNLSPWQRVQICRHPRRPHVTDLIHLMCDSFFPLAGDRKFADDKALIGGLATIAGERFVLLGQEKGHDTQSRLHHNFGMMSPEGYRKALRLMRLAARFKLPILCMIDTPGAFPGLQAEEHGQGWAIAENLREMARIDTPILVVIIGEGCSGGALGIGVGDRVAMLEHAYYSVISPEGCASILWKDAEKNQEAAEALKLNAEYLAEYGVVDTILKEPLGGAHHNPEQTAQEIASYLLEEVAILKTLSPDALLTQRYDKYRKMGQYQTDL